LFPTLPEYGFPEERGMIFSGGTRGSRRNEEGAALIAAIVFIVFIGFLGVTASFLFSSGTAATVDQLQSLRAFYAAEGGLERGIKQYSDQGSSYGGESSYLTWEGQTYPFIILVFTTDFSGVTLPANQRRIRSSCTFQDFQRGVEQIVHRDVVSGHIMLMEWREVP